GIPGDAAIDVGYLYTYITEGRGFYMWPGSVINASVHALSTEWLPYPANWVMPWSAPGGDFGPVVDTNHIGSGKIGTWLRLDITEIAEDIVRGAPNYGFILTSDDDHGVRYGLATQDYWDPSKVGYVRVMYRTAN
ncbi:MAG: hypothetical protein U9R25_07035, partial [Chloroflexota bacterium]|nr:hypothetical protein [Chloroflexota bacterium]